MQILKMTALFLLQLLEVHQYMLVVNVYNSFTRGDDITNLPTITFVFLQFYVILTPIMGVKSRYYGQLGETIDILSVFKLIMV